MNEYTDARERGERVADSIIALVRRHVPENAATKEETACLSAACEGLGAECSDLRRSDSVLFAGIDRLEREIRRRRRPRAKYLPVWVDCPCGGNHFMHGAWLYHENIDVWYNIVTQKWGRYDSEGRFRYARREFRDGEWTWTET